MAQGIIYVDDAMRGDALTAKLENPLSAFLRAVDTTMRTVDARLSFAGAALAGLVGRPIALTTAVMWLGIPEDPEGLAPFDTKELAAAVVEHLVSAGVYSAVKSRSFEVRLGEKARG